MSKRKNYIKECEISEIKIYNLNGYEQKVLLEGKNKNTPIIIYLHGGPGSPIPFCAGSRGLFPEITKDFIMVYWDQLGCGINDYLIDDTFSIENYISMTVDLIKAVHKDFPNNEINLFGVSWGSILAANAALQIPELLNRVVVYGQIIKDLFFNNEVFDNINSSNLNNKEREKLIILKSKNDLCKDDIQTIAGLIKKYTEGYQAKDGGKIPITKILWGLLTSPDYSFKNFKAILINGILKNQSLYKDLITIDLSNVLENISIPYYIIQGSTDIVTSTKYIESFIKCSNNKNLSFSIIQKNGHIPSNSGMQFIIEKGFSFFNNYN